MSDACQTVPMHIKRAYAERLPPILARKHGRKKHYSRGEILDAIGHAALPMDYSCWGMAMFEAREAFESFHRAAGETCNYLAMHTEMLSLISSSASEAWFSFDWDWIPWDIFEWLDFSP